jgi:hypothetical protein
LEEHITSIFRNEEQVKQETNMNQGCCLLDVGFLLGLVFNPEDGGDVFLQNTG